MGDIHKESVSFSSCNFNPIQLVHASVEVECVIDKHKTKNMTKETEAEDKCEDDGFGVMTTISELDSFNITTEMANRMLEDEHFKSSHQDLVAFDTLDQFNNNNLNSNMVDKNNNNNNNSSGSISTATNDNNSSPSTTNMLRTKKSVEFFLQPSDPNNKRCKPTARWNAKQVVEGKLKWYATHTITFGVFRSEPHLSISLSHTYIYTSHLSLFLSLLFHCYAIIVIIIT
jgi:hypothetical protein